MYHIYVTSASSQLSILESQTQSHNSSINPKTLPPTVPRQDYQSYTKIIRTRSSQLLQITSSRLLQVTSIIKMNNTPNSIFSGRCQISIFQYRCLHSGQENSARCRNHFDNQPCIPDVIYTEEVKDRDCAECVMRDSGYASDEIYINTPPNTATKSSGGDYIRGLKRSSLSNHKRSGIKRKSTSVGTGGDKLSRSKDIKSHQARCDELRYRRAIVKSRSEGGYRTPMNTPTKISKRIPKRSRMSAKTQLKSKMEAEMMDEMELDMEMDGYGDKNDVADLSHKLSSLTCD
ncbi:hypothetical protein BHYA_0009g00150 [Botrytis hyacinthi]|uniref:Uncharacterized protein n=1 Tax=Botrytis hyacinthi TaxID=278943 RepID=A0A4Z1GZI4_9HELO|nr:hypothetical protein BHYA_0009g00150 [Botrytis hyacinthi]